VASLVAPHLSVSVGASTVAFPTEVGGAGSMLPDGLAVLRPSDLVLAADKALYGAKHDGRGCCRARPVERA
jgi:GGDEF domain-containing protein